jgi:hypothetical protein
MIPIEKKYPFLAKTSLHSLVKGELHPSRYPNEEWGVVPGTDAAEIVKAGQKACEIWRDGPFFKYFSETRRGSDGALWLKHVRKLIIEDPSLPSVMYTITSTWDTITDRIRRFLRLRNVIAIGYPDKAHALLYVLTDYILTGPCLQLARERLEKTRLAEGGDLEEFMREVTKNYDSTLMRDLEPADDLKIIQAFIKGLPLELKEQANDLDQNVTPQEFCLCLAVKSKLRL